MSERLGDAFGFGSRPAGLACSTWVEPGDFGGAGGGKYLEQIGGNGLFVEAGQLVADSQWHVGRLAFAGQGEDFGAHQRRQGLRRQLQPRQADDRGGLGRDGIVRRGRRRAFDLGEFGGQVGLGGVGKAVARLDIALGGGIDGSGCSGFCVGGDGDGGFGQAATGRCDAALPAADDGLGRATGVGDGGGRQGHRGRCRWFAKRLGGRRRAGGKVSRRASGADGHVDGRRGGGRRPAEQVGGIGIRRWCGGHRGG